MDPASPYPGIDLLAGLILIAVSVLGVAFFSSSEAAIISLNKLRVRMLAEQGLKSAQRLQRMVQRRDRLVGTILLAENALIILAATVAGYLALKYFHRAAWPAAIASSAGITAVVVLVGEIIPKTFAAQNADRYALLIARPLVWVMRALWPLVWVLTAVARVYVHLFNLLFRTHQELALPLITEQELQLLLSDVEQQGVLEQSETEMIRSVIELGDTVAREVMVPRIDMVCLPIDAPFEEALRMALEQGHSRIPVYQDSSDNIIGVLYVKDLLAILLSDARPHGIPATCIRSAYHVPESKKVDELLRDMRTEKVHLAIVLDEFGGTAGLITIEDILEEIVGEIRDEYDVEEDVEITMQPDGSLLADGRASIHDVSDHLDVKLPTEDFDTIGGFVVGLLGHAPAAGEQANYDGIRIIVEAVDQRRVVRVRIWRRDTAPLPRLETPAFEPHRP